MKEAVSPACLSPAKLFPLFPPSFCSPFTHRAALFVSAWHAVGPAIRSEGQPRCSQTRLQPPHATFQVAAILITTEENTISNREGFCFTQISFLVWVEVGLERGAVTSSSSDDDSTATYPKCCETGEHLRHLDLKRRGVSASSSICWRNAVLYYCCVTY